MASLWSRVVSAYNAFREASSFPLDSSDFSDWDVRRQRYQQYWSYLENDTYRDMHAWATKLRVDYGLYTHIRNIHSPGWRLARFWRTHLMGGALDPDAGDGQTVSSALPIIIPANNTANEQAIRRAISQLWANSTWERRKDVYTLWGATLGDVGLEVVDDPVRRRVYLRIVDPAVLKSVTKDDFDNVKGYVREEERPHPDRPNQMVKYTEIVTRDGQDVVYQTFLNEQPYGWNGRPLRWTEPYGFVPLVVVQHDDVGLDWGWSELHPTQSKFREIDDLASILHDSIRIAMNAPMLLSGISAPSTLPTFRRPGSTTTGDQQESATGRRLPPGRNEQRYLYGPEEARATPLMLPIDIAATNERINALVQELEAEYTELDADLYTGANGESGRAVRAKRQLVEVKARQLRARYDSGAVQAHKMGMSIGALRGYAGFESFNKDSYAAGALDHRIGDRPVFDQDPLDRAEEDQAQWNVVQTAQSALGNEGALLALEQMGLAPDVLVRMRNVLTAATPEGE